MNRTDINDVDSITVLLPANQLEKGTISISPISHDIDVILCPRREGIVSALPIKLNDELIRRIEKRDDGLYLDISDRPDLLPRI